MYDKLLKRLLQPMDARSGRGIMSRGKPVYKGGLPAPNGIKTNRQPFDLEKAIRERMYNERRKRN